MSHRAGLAALLALALGLATPSVRAQTGDVPPTAAPALLKWLQAGAYKAWPKESAPHRSMGAHQTLVRTYINPALDTSLAGKAAAHPKGAAAVKELLDATGKPAGWAVSVKTSADSDGGKGWYWFEILGTAADRPTVASGNGVPLCVGCHVRGRDAVLTDHPLD
jgi:hypothetical protein